MVELSYRPSHMNPCNGGFLFHAMERADILEQFDQLGGMPEDDIDLAWARPPSIPNWT